MDPTSAHRCGVHRSPHPSILFFVVPSVREPELAAMGSGVGDRGIGQVAALGEVHRVTGAIAKPADVAARLDATGDRSSDRSGTV